MRISYNIPLGWEFSELRTLAEEKKGSIRIGPFGSALKKNEYSQAGIGVLGIEHVHINEFRWKTPKYIPKKKYQELTQYTVNEGDVLVTNMGTVGRTCVVPKGIEKSIISSHLIKVTLDKNKCLPKYLSYALNNSKLVKAQIKAKCHGAIMAGFNSTLLKELKIPLPPLPTQKKIAAILDEADRLRQLNQQVLDKYDALSQSVFLEMFGDPVVNPKGWEVKKMQEVCIKITDGTHHSPDPQTEGFPYVTAKHVKQSGLNFYAKPTFVSKEAHDEIYKRCTPEFGDVLYIKDGATTGIACINTFKEPISMLSSLALLKLNKNELNSFYLCFWLNHKGVKAKLINEFMSGAAIKRYTLKKINSFKVLVPPIDLQTQFSTHIHAIEAQKSQAQAALAKSEDLFNSLLQRAFKGELV